MKNKIIISLGVIMISFFGFTNICNAAAFLTDNFNSYTNGNLSGQGIWIGGIGGTATVQNTVVYEGTKAVKLDSSAGTASMRTLGGALLSDGSQTFYIKNNGDSMWIRLREGDISDTATQKAWVSINADIQDKIAYYDFDTTSWVTLADVPYDSWFAVQIQWRSSDHKVRYRLNDGPWSPYVTTSTTGPWVSGINVIYIQAGISVYGNGSPSYIDTIQENPGTTPFVDDFNSYSPGYICRQGSWRCPIDYYYTVENSVVNEGKYAIKGNGGQITKTGTTLADGTMTIYNYTNANGGYYIMLQEGSNVKIWIDVNADVQDKITYVNKTKPYFHATDEKITDKWYYIQIQWRSVDHMFRYNVNGGSWTSWLVSYEDWTKGIDTIRLWDVSSVYGPGGLQYFDTIQENPIVAAKTPVLIVPGIMGSRLYEDGNHLWEPLQDSDVQALYLNEAGKSAREDIYTKDIINEIPITGGNIYKSILSDLEKRKSSGDIPGYGVAPYDWRLSLPDILASGKEESDGAIYYTRATSMPYLEKALRNLVATSPTGKVTIIAHSNGGLLVKALINQLGSEASNLIDQLILIAVPQLGTPKAIGGLLHGYKVGIPEQLPIVVTPSRARDFARNTPMIYQLLPNANYYQSAGATISTPLVSFDSGDATQMFIEKYGQSITNSDELHHFLVGQEGRIAPSYSDLKNPAIGNEALLFNAEKLMQSIGSSWQAPAGIIVHQIAGIGENTLAGINYKTVKECVLRLPGIVSTIPICLKYESRLSYTPKEVIDGDGTVVVPSALAMSEADNVKRWWVNLNKYNAFGQFQLNRKHENILEINELRSFVFDNLIAKSSTSLPEFISNTQPAITTGKRLNFILHSPLMLSATDNKGNEVSETVSTIPGAHFERYGEVQVLTVPAKSSPILKLTGIKEGSFTLEVEELQEQTVIASTTFSGIISALSTVAIMKFIDGTLENAGNLEIDYDNNGAVDTSLSPNIGKEVTPDEPSLSILLAILKREIQELNINPGIKNMLVKKIENLEKKINKQKEQNVKALTKKLSNLTADIIKKAQQGIINDNDMAIMLELLNKIESNI